MKISELKTIGFYVILTSNVYFSYDAIKTTVDICAIFMSFKNNFRVAALGGLVKGGAVQCSWVDERLSVFLLGIQFDDPQNKLVSLFQ